MYGGADGVGVDDVDGGDNVDLVDDVVVVVVYHLPVTASKFRRDVSVVEKFDSTNIISN